MAEKTKKLEVELSQVRAQLERTSSAKLDKMLSIQKSALDRTSLGYGLSFSNTASTSTTVFVLFASNTDIENIDVKNGLANENLDKGKSILGAPSKLDKKDIKNTKAKKANSQKPKWLVTRPNCYKWLVTQQSNGMIASGSQNQLQSSLAPLSDLLKALMFLSTLNSFNSSPSPPV